VELSAGGVHGALLFVSDAFVDGWAAVLTAGPPY